MTQTTLCVIADNNYIHNFLFVRQIVVKQYKFNVSLELEYLSTVYPNGV